MSILWIVDSTGGFEGRFGVGTVVRPRSMSSSRRLIVEWFPVA
nr:hypothetical protein [Sediminivirga luteola]